jgi:hypothetical protein
MKPATPSETPTNTLRAIQGPTTAHASQLVSKSTYADLEAKNKSLKRDLEKAEKAFNALWDERNELQRRYELLTQQPNEPRRADHAEMVPEREQRTDTPSAQIVVSRVPMLLLQI